jgi:23S rRNA pseudouridine2605 synthase
MHVLKEKPNFASSLGRPPPSQKLQKVLAMQGLGSRRAIEQWIQAGRFTINGQIASLGVRISPFDQIALNGQLLTICDQSVADSASKLLLYYKPINQICSTQDPQGRRTVFEALPQLKDKKIRWVMVGRLDYNTSGLLLFTTDGLLSHRLLHPSYAIEREYAVRTHGAATPAIIHNLQKGVLLDGKVAHFSSVIKISSAGKTNHWYRVILQEGRQREVRRLWASQGITVSRLMRIRFGPIVLPTHLNPGQSIWLQEVDINRLRNCVGLS